MEYYAELVKEDVSYETLVNISLYFELKTNYKLAGKFMSMTGNYTKALSLFLKAAQSDTEAIEFAISIVGQAKNDHLTHELIHFLMGETDGVPKVIFFRFFL
jgi:WD repeat-containing protein 19